MSDSLDELVKLTKEVNDSIQGAGIQTPYTDQLNKLINDLHKALKAAESENAQLKLLVYDPEADITG